MKHCVYRLDDPITKEFYFGSRSCKTEIYDDMYMGSYVSWKPRDKSRLIKTIIKSNFRKREPCIKYEAELIKENIDNPLNRNYHITGIGFHTAGSVRTISKEHRKKLSIKTKEMWTNMDDKTRNKILSKFTHNKPHSLDSKKLMSNVKKGKTYSEETRKKMSESHKGYIKSDEHRENLSKSLSGKPKSKEHIKKLKEVHCIPVLQFDMNDNFIKEWKSQTEVNRILNINHVGSCCKGNYKSAGGFKWKYKQK